MPSYKVRRRATPCGGSPRCSDWREFHRELKQLTGIESCQCRKGRIQRNHIACAVLVWLRLKNLADQTRQTIYQIKHGLLSNYLIQQLKRPAVPMFMLQAVKLEKVNIERTILERANLQGANLKEANLEGARLKADFSRDLENLSLNLSPTRRETLNLPPSRVGKGARGLGFSSAFPHDVKSQDLKKPILVVLIFNKLIFNKPILSL